MGICFGLFPEGEEDNPIDWQTDGKALAEVFEWLTWDASTPSRLGLSPDAQSVFQDLHRALRVEDEFVSFENVNVEPARMKRFCQEIEMSLRAVPSRADLRDDVPMPGAKLGRTELEEVLHWFGAEMRDCIAVCDWAAAHDRRVHFRVW